MYDIYIHRLINNCNCMPLLAYLSGNMFSDVGDIAFSNFWKMVEEDFLLRIQANF